MSEFFDFEEKKESPLENSLWCEKYRPASLDDYVGNESLKSKISDYLEDGDIPHLLFYGKAGTGKTTLAKMIINSIDCDYIFINASDENNVETVRNKVRGFASSMGFREYKIIVLDEFDYMTPNAQAILRNLMETFSSYCRFILTCNYPEKIISPIVSRCQSFGVEPPSKLEVCEHVGKILTTESVKWEAEDVKMMVDSNYPDIRRIINTAQQNSRKGVLKLDTNVILDNDFRLKVIEILKSDDSIKAKFKDIRQTIANDGVRDFSDMYSLLYEKVDEYAEGASAPACILTIAEHQYKDSLVIDKEITFMSCIIQILGEL